MDSRGKQGGLDGRGKLKGDKSTRPGGRKLFRTAQQGYRGGGPVRRRYASGGTMSGYYATGYDCQCNNWDWIGQNCVHESCTCTCSNGQTYHDAGGCNNHYNDYSCSSVCDSFCAGLSPITPQGFGGRGRQGRPVRRRYARGGGASMPQRAIGTGTGGGNWAFGNPTVDCTINGSTTTHECDGYQEGNTGCAEPMEKCLNAGGVVS